MLVGAVYFVLHIMSSMASRQAHRVVEKAGGEAAAADVLWRVNWALFAALLGSLALGWQAPAIVAFVGLMVIQNLWRPALVSRINTHSSPEMGATVLSIEAQAKSLGTMVAAPCVGWAVDTTGSLWPVAAAGLLVAVPFDEVGRAAVNLGAAVLTGALANDARRWSLARQGFVDADVVAAGGREIAERDFLRARPDFAADLIRLHP